VDVRYQEAIVGTPNREYLWLLVRTPTIPEASYAALVARADGLGLDTSRLLKDPHREGMLSILSKPPVTTRI
jgi:apolipoprotein D and lipocalin family protein